MSSRGHSIHIFLLAIVAALMLAAPASAQTSPVTQVYGGDQGEVLGSFNGGGDEIPPPTESEEGGGTVPGDTTRTERGGGAPQVAAGSLPFTGFEAGLIALLGLSLLAGGLAMRRATRQHGAA
jgi:hypothetical protein